MNGLKREFQGNYFHKSTLVSSLQSAVCVMIEFLLIFGETNFVEVLKSTKSAKIVAHEKGALRYQILTQNIFLLAFNILQLNSYD